MTDELRQRRKVNSNSKESETLPDANSSNHDDMKGPEKLEMVADKGQEAKSLVEKKKTPDIKVAKDENRVRKIFTRVFSGVAILLFFLLMVYLGHIYICFLIFLVECLLVSIREMLIL